MARPTPFLITIDTEGDNIWARRPTVTTRNAAFLPRFQQLCERYGFAPTWLVDYDMVQDPAFVAFGRDVLARGAGEIGVHPHAWTTPPEYPLTGPDYEYMPFLIDYPEPIMRAKLAALTDLLEATFEVKMVSHRAGRWALNAKYAEALADLGFRVDCSVTPGIDWRATSGAPQGQGGTDYRKASTTPYVLIAGERSRLTLWEVPVTIRPARGAALRWARRAVRGFAVSPRLWNRIYRARWLRPRRGHRARMLLLLREIVHEDAPHAEFMLHSSELMPGGTPNFTDERSIEVLYEDLECMFREARSLGFFGMTLRGFANRLDARLKLASEPVEY